MFNDPVDPDKFDTAMGADNEPKLPQYPSLSEFIEYNHSGSVIPALVVGEYEEDEKAKDLLVFDRTNKQAFVVWGVHPGKEAGLYLW